LGGQPMDLHHYVGIHKPSAPLALGKPILSMMVVKRRRRLMSGGGVGITWVSFYWESQLLNLEGDTYLEQGGGKFCIMCITFKLSPTQKNNNHEEEEPAGGQHNQPLKSNTNTHPF
jgi:hypothetical protein